MENERASGDEILEAMIQAREILEKVGVFAEWSDQGGDLMILATDIDPEEVA